VGLDYVKDKEEKREQGEHTKLGEKRRDLDKKSTGVINKGNGFPIGGVGLKGRSTFSAAFRNRWGALGGKGTGG